tara:strand:+ start:4165 stop:4344 length:180 start_codon:yes stop_codon:yes gene_type:complete
MRKFEITLYKKNQTEESIEVDTPYSIYYIERETIYGVKDHIKLMGSTLSNNHKLGFREV